MSSGRQALSVASTTRAVPSAIASTITRLGFPRKRKRILGSFPPNHKDERNPLLSDFCDLAASGNLRLMTPKEAFNAPPHVKLPTFYTSFCGPPDLMCCLPQLTSRGSTCVDVLPTVNSIASIVASAARLSECAESNVLCALAPSPVSQSQCQSSHSHQHHTVRRCEHVTHCVLTTAGDAAYRCALVLGSSVSSQ